MCIYKYVFNVNRFWSSPQMTVDGREPSPSSPSAGRGTKPQRRARHSPSDSFYGRWLPPQFVCAAMQLRRDWPPLSSPLTFSTHMLSSPSFGRLAPNTVASVICCRHVSVCAPLELEKVPVSTQNYLFISFFVCYLCAVRGGAFLFFFLVLFSVVWPEVGRGRLECKTRLSPRRCDALAAHFEFAAALRGSLQNVCMLVSSVVCCLRQTNLRLFPDTRSVRRPFWTAGQFLYFHFMLFFFFLSPKKQWSICKKMGKKQTSNKDNDAPW